MTARAHAAELPGTANVSMVVKTAVVVPPRHGVTSARLHGRICCRVLACAVMGAPWAVILMTSAAGALALPTSSVRAPGFPSAALVQELAAQHLVLAQGADVDSVLPPATQERLWLCSSDGCADTLKTMGSDLVMMDITAILLLRTEGGTVRARYVDVSLGAVRETAVPLTTDMGPSCERALRQLLLGPPAQKSETQHAAAVPQEKPAPRVGWRMAGPAAIWAGLLLVLFTAVVGAGAGGARLLLSFGSVVGRLPTPGLRGTPRFLLIQSPPYVLVGVAAGMVLASVVLLGVGYGWLVGVSRAGA